MSDVAINKIHWPVTALGPGRRLGIWFQGCSIGCPGCLALDTWNTPPETWTTVRRILDAVAEPLLFGLDGVTISGGEPFDQPEALLQLASGLRELTADSQRQVDLLCYSGRPLGFLRASHGVVLGEFDAIISDPYSELRPTRRLWRGSENQRLTPLTSLGESRYGDILGSEPEAPEIQVQVDEEHVWMIGVPRQGDLARVEQRLNSRGVSLGAVSWRT